MPIGGKNTLELIIAARDRTRGAFTKVNSRMRMLEGTTKKVTAAMKGAAKASVLLAAAASAASIVGSTKAFVDFEDAMANVRKTTGFTKEQIGVLGDAINDMALRIPVAQTELAGIAAVAGQLGITGQKNILDFTETAAKMSTAFDMSAESVAIAAAKLSNIYDIPIDQVSNLGSAINVLGNTTAASESQILAFSMALGPTAQQLGFAATEAVSLGASMISIGMDASNAGTRLNRAFSMIGQNLDELASFMGVTTEEFTESFERMPMETFMGVLEKLSQVEGKLKANTIASELFNEIGAKAIKGLTGNLDGLRENLKNSKVGFEENVSLTEEFAAKTDTLKARFTLLKNTVTSLLIDIGGELAPTIQTIIEGLREIAPAAKEVLYEVGSGFKEAFESISRQIAPALKPFMEKVDEAGKKLTKGFNFKMLMDDIGVFIGAGLRPLIEALGWVIDKLGPLWDALHAVGEAFHFLADELRTAEGRLDNLKDAQRELTDILKKGMDDVNAMAASLETTTKVPIAILKEWKMALDAFTEGTGSYRDAIAAINAEITKQKDLWSTASKEERAWIDQNLLTLGKQKKALEELNNTAKKHTDAVISGTEEAIKKTKEFIITIGKTKIEFKDAAAEVVKNADAYEKLQKSAQTLLDLDWSVFTEFKAALPNIEAGLINMESSFVGLKDTLEDNIEALGNVQQAVIDISNIAAPFLEKGFLNGVKAIGDFASALKNAGSAIGDFGSLQDVSIEGCINFSLRVRDMVSALAILESQMEDLVPAFGNLNSLITDIAETFVWTTGKKESLADEINRIAYAAKDAGGASGELWSILEEVTKLTETGFRGEFAAPYIERYKAGVEDVEDITADFLASGEVLERQMGKTTNALKHQTDQLAKITEALEPYLNFMRTLNELAGVSTLSTSELNKGLNSIKDTLVNLGSALSDFDLTPAMKSLFGTGIEGEAAGAAKGFMLTMVKYESEFASLIAYIDRLSAAITTLSNAFGVLSGIDKTVLADQNAMKAIFGDITKMMTDFSTTMGEGGFADDMAKGLKSMLASMDPLMTYFRENNAAVTEFNITLGTFKTTLTSVVDVLDSMKKISDMSVPSVEELTASFDKASEMVATLNEALMKHVGAREGPWDMEKYFGSIIKTVEKFSKDWNALSTEMGEAPETFCAMTSVISGLIGNIVLLTDAFEKLKDVSIVSGTEMAVGLNIISKTVAEMTTFLDEDIFKVFIKNMADFAAKWNDINLGVKDAVDSFGEFASVMGSITSASKGLETALTDVDKIAVVTSDSMVTAFSEIPLMVENITAFLATDTFKAIKAALGDLSTGFEEHRETLKKVMPDLEDSIGTFTTLASGVTSLSDAFLGLKDAAIVSSRDMEKAIGRIKTFTVIFTEALASNLESLVGVLGDLDAEWKKHSKVMEEVMPSFTSATGDITSLIGSLTSIGSALKSLSEMGTLTSGEFSRGFKSLIGSISNFMVSLKNNVGPLIGTLEALKKAWLENEGVLVPLMQDFVTITRNFASMAINANNMVDAFKELTENSGSLEKGFESLIKFIKDVVENTKEFYTPEAAAELTRFISDVGTVIAAFGTLATDLKDAMSKIKNAIAGAVDNIEGKISSLSNLVRSAYFWGANIMSAFITGIESMSGALESAVARLALLIQAYLGVASPTELGALKNVEEWPRNLVKSFSEGINAEMSGLNASLGGMVAPAIVSGGGGGNRTSVSFHITQNIKDRSTADYSTREIEKMLNRHMVL